MLPALVLTVLAALGVFMCAQAWRHGRQRVAMRRWPTAPATIHGHRTRLFLRSQMVDVEVSYRHEGRAYRVWCKSPTRSGYSRGSVQPEAQVAAAFPVGTTHRVYVNPGRADEAFLELPEAHMLAIFAGAGVILIGLPASLALPAMSEVDSEVANLLFMALLGVVLSVLVIFMGVALVKTPRARRRR